MKNINIFEPTIFIESKKKLVECLKNNEISTHSQKIIDQFENSISNIDGSKKTVALNSGSTALFLSMKALGIKENDLVIMPSYTFVATANAVVANKAKPWFFDIEKNSLTLNLDQVLNTLLKKTFKKGKFYYHKKTKQRVFAICPVYTLGFIPDLIKIKKISKKFNLKIISDAACALGSKYDNKKITKYSDAVCYSFNGNKSITSGGGGAVSSNNVSFAKKIQLLSTNYKTGNYFHSDLGFNLRITGLHAALGLGQIKNFKKIENVKRKINNKYLSFIEENNLKTFYPQKKTRHIQWLNFVVLKKNIKKSIFLSAQKHKINLNYFWTPMHFQPYLKNNLKENLSNTQFIWKKILVLPSSLHLSKKELGETLSFLKKIKKF
jgi:perosamine synthetase